MKVRNILAATAAISLAASPVLAQSADRTSQPVGDESEIGGEGSTGTILAVLAAAAVIGGIIIAADNDDDDDPESP